jgi:hypothetical protein
MRRSLLFVHRWLGVGLSMLLTMWFVSGIVMMYWSYPTLDRLDYLRHAPRIPGSAIRVSPAEAFTDGRPPSFTLATQDGRPVYFAGSTTVFADDGRAPGPVTPAMVDRAAAAWAARPLREATHSVVTDVDQWTLGDGLRELLPLQKYSWPDGQQVYVDGRTADVVQYTTRASRFWSYLGAIPHWLYLPALRTQDARWFAVMTWGSLLGMIATLLGLIVAVWIMSPRRRYRRGQARSALPYSGWKRRHVLLGLVGGVTAITWTFSGLTSLQPFGIEKWLLERTVTEDIDNEEYTRVFNALAGLLVDRPRPLDEYDVRPPAAVIASLHDFEVKSLDFGSLDGRPVYLATNGHGDSRLVPMHGDPVEMLDVDDLAGRIRSAVGDSVDVRVLEGFDSYYRDRKGRLPLPVISIAINDAVHTRYYVDPRSVSIIESYSARGWVHRWLHHGLHSFDVPWLYNHRPLWDIVMVTLLLAGTALCATSLLLAYRVIARKVLVVAAYSRRSPPLRRGEPRRMRARRHAWADAAVNRGAVTGSWRWTTAATLRHPTPGSAVHPRRLFRDA